MKKKTLLKLISMVMVFSLLFPLLNTIEVNAASIDFSDVKKNDWFYEDVQRLVNAEAIEGFNDGTFKPQNPITRAEFVKILVTSLKYDITSWSYFKDTEKHWAADYISTAIDYRVIDKEEYGNSFEPNKPITRLEMAKMLVRALKISTENVVGDPFVDISSEYTTAAYRDYLLMGSFTNGKRYFHPEDSTKRAEASAVIVRAMDYNANPYGYRDDKERKAKQEKKTAMTAKNLPDINGSSTPTQEQVLNLLNEYDEDGYFILNESLKRKNNFMSWINSENYLRDIASAVHEECHSYTNFTGSSFGSTKNIYLGNNKKVIVELTDVFYTNEMASTIPEDLRTYRYNTYIGNTSKYLSANSQGVYGLLDEFTAYYYGTKTSCNLYGYYIAYATSPDDWFDYIGNVKSQYGSYAEFKYYILKYLLYAKEYHKDVYDDIMANGNLKIAYNTIEQKFYDLIQNFMDRKKDLVKHLQSQGYDAYEEDGVFNLVENKSGCKIIRTDNENNKDFDLLMAEMEKEKYQEIIQALNE